MKVILTNNYKDIGYLVVLHKDADCDCDCNCACPIDTNTNYILPLPVAYYIELTTACNNLCPSCANKDSHQGDTTPILDIQQWKTIINQLASHSHYFKITGGEPTLHPNFDQIIGMIETTGIHFTLFSNARWIRPQHLVKLLKNTETFDGLLISLHGHNAAIHEIFSGVSGSFEETIANIKLAAETKLPFSLSIVINASNFDCIDKTLELALSLGANHLVCNRLIGADVPGITPTNQQLRYAIEMIESLRIKNYPIHFGNCIPQCFIISSSRGCTAGNTFATIDPWGRVRPCNHTSLVAGSLLQESIENLWHGEVMNYWRDLNVPGCHECSAYQVCHSGCRAQALIEKLIQDPLMRGPLKTYDQEETELKLYSELRPIATFEHSTIQGVKILFYKSQVITVPDKLTGLVPRLNGAITLKKVEQEYGPNAINWLGTLYKQGMVRWQTPAVFQDIFH